MRREDRQRQAALGATFAAFWRWHSAVAKPLTPEEIDHYLAVVAQPPLPGDEAECLVVKLRPWAEYDDGRQFYMLNMIPVLRRAASLPWGAGPFDRTPEGSNAFYEKSLTSLWLRDASYPRLGGQTLSPTHWCRCFRGRVGSGLLRLDP